MLCDCNLLPFLQDIAGLNGLPPEVIAKYLLAADDLLVARISYNHIQ